MFKKYFTILLSSRKVLNFKEYLIKIFSVGVIHIGASFILPFIKNETVFNLTGTAILANFVFHMFR